MVTTFVKSLPKRYKIVGVFLFTCLILSQLWISSNSSKPRNNTLITEEQEEQDRSDPISFEKQSLLYGFQGFKSKLPRLQYDFPKEPIEYTNLRESRREAIKQSFLHGWKGYSNNKSSTVNSKIYPFSFQK